MEAGMCIMCIKSDFVLDVLGDMCIISTVQIKG